jgi:hypothetical protein
MKGAMFFQIYSIIDTLDNLDTLNTFLRSLEDYNSTWKTGSSRSTKYIHIYTDIEISRESRVSRVSRVFGQAMYLEIISETDLRNEEILP